MIKASETAEESVKTISDDEVKVNSDDVNTERREAVGVGTGNKVNHSPKARTTTMASSKEDLILKSPTLGATSALTQSFAAMGTGGPSEETSPLSPVPPPQPAQPASQTIFTDPFNETKDQTRTSPRFSFPATTSSTSSTGNVSPISTPIPIPDPSPSGLPTDRRQSVSAVLFGTSPLPSNSPAQSPPFSSFGNPSSPTYSTGPISPPILSASAQAAWGKPAVGLGNSFSAQGEMGLCGDKMERGQGVLRRLSLGASARPKFKPSKSDFDQSPAPPAIVINQATDIERPFNPDPDFPSTTTTSTMTTRSNPSASSSSSYNNPFSGLSMSLDDDHHEHEYERSFGAIEGNLLERAKSIGSGPASRTWTGLGRRKSLQDNSHGETPYDLLNDREVAMKPRRVSFGWSGFAKPAAPTPTPANKTKMPGVPGQVDGLPQKPQQEGLRVGRGRSGSTGQEGKKRSVSPMGEHLLRGSSHF